MLPHGGGTAGAILLDLIPPMWGYLDIETTGLNPARSQLTVVGLELEEPPAGRRLVQLVAPHITPERLLRFIGGARVLYTYNGARFDLPFLRAKLGLDLTQGLLHRDLMYDCWRLGLYGGLKAVERHLGIRRRLVNLNGQHAAWLWRQWQRGDRRSLQLLLLYNREDLRSLRLLRRYLGL